MAIWFQHYISPKDYSFDVLSWFGEQVCSFPNIAQIARLTGRRCKIQSHTQILVGKCEHLAAVWSPVTVCCLLCAQPGSIPPRPEPSAAVLLLRGLQHPAVGPALQPVPLCAPEPLQRRHLACLHHQRGHHGQVRQHPGSNPTPTCHRSLNRYFNELPTAT